MDTRAMSKVKMGYEALDASSSQQDGKHLLGSIPGDDHDEFDLEEQAMRMDVLTEEEKKAISPLNFKKDSENITGEDEFMTPLQGNGMGATTKGPELLIQGFSAGGGGAVTKKLVINDEESMIEEARRLDMEVKQYDILLKRARLEAMRAELEKLSPKKTTLSGISDQRDWSEQVVQGHRRDMLKIIVPEFRRGNADEALNSISNFNVVLRACGLEAVAYLEKTGSAEEEVDLGTLVQRLVAKDFEVVASMRAEFGERGGRGSEMMRHLRDYFINPLVYESTDAETELLKVDWNKLMTGDGIMLKAGLDKVWAITKLMPEGREGTEAGWVAYVLDRTPAALAVEYYRQLMAEPVLIQQKAAGSTRSFAVLLAKSRNNMIRRETMFEKELKGGAGGPVQADGPLLQGEPPQFNAHEKGLLTEGCPRCHLFGCAKAFKAENDCDIFGEPTAARVARIAKSEKYKVKVDTYRKEKKQKALVYEETAAPSSNVHVDNACDLLSNKDYAALVESLIDDEDDMEAEFSMYKCAMIKDGTYYSKAAE